MDTRCGTTRRPSKASALSLACLLAAVAACGSGTDNSDAGTIDDAGSDAGSPHDAGTLDAGSDAGNTLDAGTADAGDDAGMTLDAGDDAGTMDAGDDAGTMDAGDDAGTADAGMDAGTIVDAGTDAGPADAGVDAGVDAGTDGGVAMIPSSCNGSVATTYTPVGTLPTKPAGLFVPSGFTMEAIAQTGGARELVALPNGDLLVATGGTNVKLIPNAESYGDSSPNPGAAADFLNLPAHPLPDGGADSDLEGITYDAQTCTLYASAQYGVYAITYTDGQKTATVTAPIALVRTGAAVVGGDGDVHHSTSVAVSGDALYAAAGSSCNACIETDPTRAAILQYGLDGSNAEVKATHMRNAIALATNPATGTVWAGGAGQDDLPVGHPFEYFDPVTLHGGLADYGWPFCEEDHTPYMWNGMSKDCSNTVVPRVEFPAYSTLIGAVFYPTDQTGTYAFPAENRGLYVTAHGSWHMSEFDAGVFDAPPRVAFVPITGDTPATEMSWSSPNPSSQWTEFSGGWQTPDGTNRIARATGIAVGSRGSLFVADDQNGLIFRIRKTTP